jgi:ERCC4-type nuclease
VLAVDDRIGSREFHKPLRRMGAPARIVRLEYADFAWHGSGPHGRAHIGVERKTVSEILGAITDSRFTGRQLPGLLKTYDYVYLIVEGSAKIDPRSGVLMMFGREAGFTRVRHLYSTYKNFLTTLAAKGRLIVEPTHGHVETTHLLHTLYGWWQKPWASHKSAYHVEETKPEAAILDERTVKRQVLAQLPYVGWERSRRVSQHFPSLRAAFTATEDDWMAALGVKQGRTMARGLVAVCKAIETGRAKA